MAEDNFDEAFDIDRILRESSGNSPETPTEVVKPREKKKRSPSKRSETPLSDKAVSGVSKSELRVLFDDSVLLKLKTMSLVNRRPLSLIVREVLLGFLEESWPEFVKSDVYKRYCEQLNNPLIQ